VALPIFHAFLAIKGLETLSFLKNDIVEKYLKASINLSKTRKLSLWWSRGAERKDRDRQTHTYIHIQKEREREP
jgi:hypothetical protein